MRVPLPDTWRETGKLLVVAGAFGGLALAVVAAELTLEIPGTGVVTDPRELFTTTGAAFTGPVGAVVIGVLAGTLEPDIPKASLLAHVAGGLWMGFAYKKLVHERLQMPAVLAGWAVLVFAYYYVFVIPGFVTGQALFYPAVYDESYGAGTSWISAYGTLGRGAFPEALLTSVVTTLALTALPRRMRRPLW